MVVLTCFLRSTFSDDSTCIDSLTADNSRHYLPAQYKRSQKALMSDDVFSVYDAILCMGPANGSDW